jgi:hypothetical protein
MISNKDSAFTLFEVLAERNARKRRPSQRDLDIAAAVRVQGRRHADVAAEFGLTRRRVSQICRQIEKWHLNIPSWERGEVDEEQRSQPDRILQRDQLTEIYGAALRAYARSEQPLVTVRRGKRGEQRWSDRSQRQQRLDTGSLRVALKAIEMQWKLNDRPFKKDDEGKDEKGRLCIYFRCVADMLEFARKDAEARGAVPRIPGGPMAAVEQMLRMLLGVPEEKSEVGGQEAEVRESEAVVSGQRAEPELQHDRGAGEVSPPLAPPYREADASRSPGVLASNSSKGSVWEAPPEAPWETPAPAANDDDETSYAIAAAAGSDWGSAPKIEQGNVSREAPRDRRAGDVSPPLAPPHREADASRSPGGAQIATTPPTRLERLLASSRHLSRGHRRRLESMVAHRRGSAGSG